MKVSDCKDCGRGIYFYEERYGNNSAALDTDIFLTDEEMICEDCNHPSPLKNIQQFIMNELLKRRSVK